MPLVINETTFEISKRYRQEIRKTHGMTVMWAIFAGAAVSAELNVLAIIFGVAVLLSGISASDMGIMRELEYIEAAIRESTD